MQPPAGVLGPWHEFYTLLGAASATMIGLLFVAASVGSGAFSADRRAAMRVFLSASVVNFSLVLGACLIVLAPISNWMVLGLMVLIGGLFGLGHSCLGWRDSLRDGLIARIDLEDRIWYMALPIVGYLSMAAAGGAMVLQRGMGSLVLAISTGLLLAVGIHNAWDITLWSVSRRSH